MAILLDSASVDDAAARASSFIAAYDVRVGW